MALHIEGLLLESETMSAEWGKVTITGTVLIRMDSPLENVSAVQAQLPAYDFGVTAEPTFTIGLSSYPGRPDLVLKTAPSVREHEAGRPWWLVDMQWESAQWLNEMLPKEDQGKGNGGRPKKIKENDGTAAIPKEVVLAPYLEPPTWSSATRSVKATKFHDATGAPLLHANYLPVTEGVDVDFLLEVHTYTFNVNAVGFNYLEDIAPYINKISSVDIPNFHGAKAKHVLCEDITCTENYRTVNLGVPDGQDGTDANKTYHYYTLNARFVIDRRNTEHGYFREANRRVSMHTLQMVTTIAGGTSTVSHVPIPVNTRGDVAESPWPLLPSGAAVPYNLLNVYDPEEDYAWIDPLLPEEYNLKTFTDAHGLKIP
jgi:hypothetical protein